MILKLAQAAAAFLANAAPVSAIVAGRIYPEYNYQQNKLLPDAGYPQIIYTTDNDVTDLANDGPIGLRSANLILQCVGQTYADAAATADAVVSALDGQRGNWTWTDDQSHSQTTSIQGIFLREDGISDRIVTEPQTEQVLYYVKEISFQAFYS